MTQNRGVIVPLDRGKAPCFTNLGIRAGMVPEPVEDVGT